jgi:hypothetical protein
MDTPRSGMSQRTARAAGPFEQRLTGHIPAITRAFRTDTVAHVFLLAEPLPTQAWSGPFPEGAE